MRIEAFLDGVPIPFNGINRKEIESLDFIGIISGVYVFEHPYLPKGTLDIYQDGARVALIRGLGK